MERITVADAERNLTSLVHRVYSEGISIELEQEQKVLARLTPAGRQSSFKVSDLNAFLLSLPPLGEDANAFEQELREIRRRFPARSIHGNNGGHKAINAHQQSP